MPGAQQIGANVLTTPQQIAGGFFLFAGNVNGRQGAGTEEDRQIPRVSAIRFDAIAGSARNQGGRDDVTGDSVLRQRPLQLEPARPGFVAATRSLGVATDPLDEAENRRTIR
jgi:hypothetical protein